MDCPVHHQPDPALRVIGQAQHAGRAGGAAEHGLHKLRRGEGEAGGAQLGAEDLGLEGLAAGHGQQVERRLLPVAEKQVLADGDAQHLADHIAVGDGVGGLVGHPSIGDVQPVQQGKGLQLHGGAALCRGGGADL